MIPAIHSHITYLPTNLLDPFNLPPVAGLVVYGQRLWLHAAVLVLHAGHDARVSDVRHIHVVLVDDHQGDRRPCRAWVAGGRQRPLT